MYEFLPDLRWVRYLYAAREPGCSTHCIANGLVSRQDLAETRSRRMAYVIAEPCVDVLDQACVDVCPVDCIHFEEGKDRMLYIEPDECIDCGACEPECPVEAIFTEEDVPDEWKPYTEINVQWFKDKDDARAKVNELRPE